MKNRFLWLIILLLPEGLFISLNAQNGITIQNIADTDIPTSKALPSGMKLVWNDEFNGKELDHTKWWDRYFSSLDWFNPSAYKAFLEKKLPVADYQFTGTSIILKATDNIYPGANRQVSSIQTYNWETNTNMMDNSLGGYFEARIRRDIPEGGDKVNLAFWFDSPGPDLKYYLEKGGEAFGTRGIRPRGQIFEIDMCEYITTEIVLHGNVDPKGRFERNIGHYIHKGDFKGKWVVHSVLWTPAGLKFYIDGNLIKEWWNPKDIKSPNHDMNMFFGAYGTNGVTMEVDYVRYYQWRLEEGNLLPNSGFEYSDRIFPWQGTAQIIKEGTYSGTFALKLLPNTFVEQYIYLDHSIDYELAFWAKGEGVISVGVENIIQVSGLPEDMNNKSYNTTSHYTKHKFQFKTTPEPLDNKKTIRVKFENNSDKEIILDDLSIIRKCIR